ncbi:MAG: glycosyltransferase involved in cell wall biosynthesis [Halioglobus sp.]|jgi:glycosyltransferase involved in cell wall biosynthesis
MKILLLESFYGVSHKQWLDGFVANSTHKVDLLSMPGRHWKWRMAHSAIHFSNEIIGLEQEYDLILSTSFTNIATLRGLLIAKGDKNAWYNRVAVHVFFHENQITYPWSKNDPDIILKRDNHYGWINYLSCLASDRVIFNSAYHRDDLIGILPTFLAQFPDRTPDKEIEKISVKSHVLSIGVNMKPLLELENIKNDIPIIIWNHRWEYDKNPHDFFESLFELQEEGMEFEVIVAGKKYKRSPKIFEEAKMRLGARIIHFGYAKSRLEYLQLLAKADIIPVTSNQDFFGISAVEGIASGCYPILPDRLAFPEHLDRPKYNDCYFSNTPELVKKLRAAIKAHPNNTQTTRTQVEKYDWSNQIAGYDDFFRI